MEKTGWVDLDDHSNVKNDKKFIKVSKSYADVIVTNDQDHSALILNGGIITDTYGYLASTHGVGSYLFVELSGVALSQKIV